MQDLTRISLVDSPEEALTPREHRLDFIANILNRGAIINGILAIIVILAAALGAFGVLGDTFTTLQNVSLFRSTVAPDTASLMIILTMLLNTSLLLVLMTGVLAREGWAFIGIWLLVIGNVAALVTQGFTPGIITILIGLWAGIIAGRDVRAFRMNPVMLKELRGRMRGVRAFAVLTIYLGLMSGVTVLLFLIFTALNRSEGSAAAGEIGRVLFMGIVGIELLLIIFIAPAFTAGAITGERERQTYDLLRTTLLASPPFVIGKLESALSYTLLLLLAAIPLQSIAFLFGGVTEVELLLAFIILTVTAIALGTVGIYFSAIAPRTLSASVRAYTVALVVTFGIPLVLSFILNIFTGALFGTGTGITRSPVLEGLLVYLGLFLVSINPIATALASQQLLIDQQVTGFWTTTLSSNGDTIPMVSPWISFTIIYLAVSTVLIVLAIRRMRKVEA
ncbi:MAG: hypothetical protein D6737_09095 [Chloroflexi bacterium]|nr:MAG: hypothetical protein D6737_09095 [Chloroflexota bacterium]